MSTASERRGNELKYFKDFYLKAEARIWPWLSHMCHFARQRFGAKRAQPHQVGPVTSHESATFRGGGGHFGGRRVARLATRQGLLIFFSRQLQQS